MNDLRTAFGFLTILPVGIVDNLYPGRSFAYFPLVGWVIGLLLCGSAALMGDRVSPELRAFTLLVLWVIVTGGLHLDGYADSCDGLMATTDSTRRLEILKDPRVGSWALIGVVLLLLGKWTALGRIDAGLLILPPVLGRWGIVLAAYSFPYARSDGMGAYFRQGLGRMQVFAASTIGIVSVAVTFLLTRQIFVILCPIPLLLVYVLGRWAAGRLGGGLTGDVYGALCEVVELVTLLGLAIWAGN